MRGSRAVLSVVQRQTGVQCLVKSPEMLFSPKNTPISGPKYGRTYGRNTHVSFFPFPTSILSSLPPKPSLHHIKKTHARIVVSGHTRHTVHLLSLLSLSSFLPFPLNYSLSIFNSFSFPTVFAFNAIIRCHAKSNSPPSNSLVLYSSIRRRFLSPNQHTFTFLLNACTKGASTLGILTSGVQVHVHIVKLGYACHLFVKNALIHLYCECTSSVEFSKRVFEEDTLYRDVVTWNSMLACLVRNENVCDAEKLFDEMPERDVVSWSTMIMGYVQNGVLEDGLECFRLMRKKGIRPNEAIFVTVLSASTQLGLLGCGRFIHSTIRSLRLPITINIGTAL